MKNNIKIEKIDIPPILEEDILETIQQAKIIVKELGVKKQTNVANRLKTVLLYYGWKGILIQGTLGLLMLILCWFIIPKQDKFYSISLLLTGGIVMSICMFFEWIRSDVYSMSELEKTCPYSMQRLFLLKMLLLGSISLLGIFILSIYLASYSELKFFTLFSGGCIPFFLMTGMTLHFQMKEYILQSFISLYVVVLSAIMVLELNFLPFVLNILDHFGGMFTLFSFLYCMLLVYYQARRTGYESL